MDGETRGARRSAPPEQAAEGASTQPPERVPTERFGPLLVERHRKDDGRALLLYEWREDEH
jgi:hypothetical protein